MAALVEERLVPVFAILNEAVNGGGKDITGPLAGFIGAISDTIERHPWLPAPWMREVPSEGGALRLVDHRLAAQLPLRLARQFAAARALRNPNLDPRLPVASLLGLTLCPAASAPIRRRMFDADDLDAADPCDQLIALLDRGLCLSASPTTEME